MTNPPAGRPRSAEANRAIIGATIQLLIEGGFGRLTVDDVAARAGVGKATIYRRWSSKEDLLRATVASFEEESAEEIDTGNLRDDLQVFQQQMFEEFVESDAARLMPQLTAEAQLNPDLRKLIHKIADARRDGLRQILGRAQGRDELHEDLDLEVVIDLVIAPIFIRRLVTGAGITTQTTDEALEVVLRGIVRECEQSDRPSPTREEGK